MAAAEGSYCICKFRRKGRPKAGFSLETFEDGKFWVYEKAPGENTSSLLATCRLCVSGFEEDTFSDTVLISHIRTAAKVYTPWLLFFQIFRRVTHEFVRIVCISASSCHADFGDNGKGIDYDGILGTLRILEQERESVLLRDRAGGRVRDRSRIRQEIGGGIGVVIGIVAGIGIRVFIGGVFRFAIGNPGL